MSEPAFELPDEPPPPPRLRAVHANPDVEVVVPDDPPVLTVEAGRVMLAILRAARARASVD